jgi:antitoxin component of MazEF toxin-antitoxin module
VRRGVAGRRARYAARAAFQDSRFPASSVGSASPAKNARDSSRPRAPTAAACNSLGIVIEKPILELLDITRDTELELRTDGERLIVTPIRKGRKQRVKAAAVDEVLADHASTFRKLAK